MYVRVSSDEQERGGTSLDTQAARCLQYAQERGYAVVERFTDTASGFTLDRPGVTAMRALVTAGEVDVVVTYAVDRLSRSQNHIGILFDEMQRHGVALEVVSEPFEDTAIGRFVLAARAFMAEVEREKIAERTSRGRRQRASEGRYVGSLPYGYARDGMRLVVDEAQAEVVRRIFDLYLRNVGTRAIATLLNAEGVPTMTGARWYTQTVRGILRRETYTGVLLYSDVRVADAVPAIIDLSTFEAVQARMRRKGWLGGGRTQVSDHLLTGVLFCGVCGSRMRGMRQRPKQLRSSGEVRTYDYRGYVCSRWKDAGLCQSNYHGAEDLEARVVRDLTSTGVRRSDRTADTRLAALEADLAANEAAMVRNERRRQTVINRIADETLTGTMAREAVAQVEMEQAALLADQRRIVTERLDVERALARRDEWPEQARQLLDETVPLAERKRIVQDSLERVEVYPDNPEPVLE